MAHPPLQPLQAALFFDNTAAFNAAFGNWPALLAQLNANLDGLTPAFRIMAGVKSATEALFSNDIFHISVSLRPEALGLDGFAGPLGAPYYTTLRPELVQGVQDHRHAVLVTVGLGAIPMPMDDPAIAALMQKAGIGLDQDQGKFEQRLRIAQTTALTLCDAAMPTVVHWGQSDQLFAGTTFVALAETGFCLPLYVHPGFSGSGAMVGDSYCTGVNAYGAHHLIGKHVTFEEHPQAMGRSYEQVLQFIAWCRDLGRVPGTGETLKCGPDAVLEVHEIGPTPHHPCGEIRLRLRAGDPPRDAPGDAPHPVVQTQTEEDRLRAVFRGDTRGARAARRRPAVAAAPATPRAASRTAAAGPRPSGAPTASAQDPDSVVHQLRTLGLGLVLLVCVLVGGSLLRDGTGWTPLATTLAEAAR